MADPTPDEQVENAQLVLTYTDVVRMIAIVATMPLPDGIDPSVATMAFRLAQHVTRHGDQVDVPAFRFDMSDPHWVFTQNPI